MTPSRQRGQIWIVALLSAAADQASKAVAVRALSPEQSVHVIPRFFDLTLVTNRGGVFGILRDLDLPLRSVLFSAVPLAAVLLIIWYGWRLPGERAWAGRALGMILGGAAGNLIDRFRLGYVIDFLDVYAGPYHWPAFNLADSCICVGVAILLTEGLVLRRTVEAPPEALPPPPP
jgi:signal peptidase II